MFVKLIGTAAAEVSAKSSKKLIKKYCVRSSSGSYWWKPKPRLQTIYTDVNMKLVLQNSRNKPL
jgi:hypothetical protein